MSYRRALFTTLVFSAALIAGCNSSSSSSSGSGSGSGSFTAASAEDDFASTSKGESLVIDVTDNDQLNDADSLNVTAVDASSAQGGSISLRSDGDVDYTPPADFSGSDDFSYTITDSRGNTDTANVYVIVSDPEAEAICDDDVTTKRDNGESYCVESSFVSFDGTVIAFQLFVPATNAQRQIAADAGATLGLSEKGFSPLLVHSHGFGGSKAEDFTVPGPEIDRQIALDAWQAGYWVISYTQRGFSGGADSSELASGNQIGMMSPALEGLDFVRLVDWAVCHLRSGFDPTTVAGDVQTEPDENNCGLTLGSSTLMNDAGQRLTGFSDDPSLGTIGYSYGGAFQFNAQSVDTRVDAILPMGTWHDLRFSLHPNDAPKTSWIEIMTAFALQGGNGEPLPDLIVEGNAQANGANTEQDDQPHNKQRQVSVKNHNILAGNGTVAYCDAQKDIADPVTYPDLEGSVFATHPHVTFDRTPRADLLMIQGHGDTLFNMNEGFDNARCFAAENPALDVRLISQTSGHPLPYLGPPNFAGQSTSMYLDEIVHCGNGLAAQRYNLREVGFAWLEDRLRNAADIDTVFPHKLCVTQANTHPNLVLDTGDEYFSNGTTNTEPTAYQFPREGLIADDVADLPVGGQEFELAAQTLVTGPNPSPDALASRFAIPEDPRNVFAPLTTVTESQVLAGVPLVSLDITRANPLNDELFYAGIGVQRCHTHPYDEANTETCDEDAPFELLQFQMIPIRIFPTLAAEMDVPSATLSYPADDPRNTLATPQVFPIRWGTDPGNAANTEQLNGRLIGVTARLHPGDQVGLMLRAEHPVFMSLSSPTVGQVTVEGTVYLPLQTPTTPPDVDAGTRPQYIIETAEGPACPALDPACSPIPLPF